MTTPTAKVALIKGDGIGVDVAEAACEIVTAATTAVDCRVIWQPIQAGADYYRVHGVDIESGGEEAAGHADAIFLGAIGMPGVSYPDGTEISPHLRLRERYQLYAGVRPARIFPNTPPILSDRRSHSIDLVVLRESSEGLFYSAAVHNRNEIANDNEVRETLRITRGATEKLHRFAFELARKRKARGAAGKVTCVDKANVFRSMALFRKIYNEVAESFPDIDRDYNYVDAQALALIRRPWDFDVIVTENMFGDILSDLVGGLVGGMGMAACGEYGDRTALFQPAHGSAPDIAGQDKANPLAAILSAEMMLDYLAEKKGIPMFSAAAKLIREAVHSGFLQQILQPVEFGGDMGTRAITNHILGLIDRPSLPRRLS